MAASFESYSTLHVGQSFLCECQVIIRRYTADGTLNLLEPPVEFVFKKNVEYNTIFKIPFITNSRYLKLLGNSKYVLEFRFKRNTPIMCYVMNPKKITVDSHGSSIEQLRTSQFLCQVRELYYSVSLARF